MKIWHFLDVPILPTLPQSLVKRAFMVLPDGLALNLQFNSKPGQVSILGKRKWTFLLSTGRKVFLLCKESSLFLPNISVLEKLKKVTDGNSLYPREEQKKCHLLQGAIPIWTFKYSYVVGGKQIRMFALQAFLACRTARQVERKLTQLEFNPQQEKQRTAGASIMNKSAALCCEKKLRKSEVILTL